MFEIDINDPNSVSEAREKMKSAKALLNAIVESFWNDELSDKRKIELVHAAKFIRSEGGAIQSMDESPDFLIDIEEMSAGLEIRQLFTRHVEYNRHIQNLFNHAANFYEESFPDDRLLVNFWLEDGFNYRSNQRGQYVPQITAYVRAIASGESELKPDFIDHIDVHPHSQLSFNFNEGAYFSQAIENEVFLEAIAEKEEKIDNYIANSGTSHQWLLLVNKGAGSESFDTEDFVGIENLESKFERIYLLRDFESEVIRIC